MKYFPIFLHVENKTAIVFGGGADAAAKLRLLKKTEARLLVVAEHVDQDVLDLGTAAWVQAEPTSFDIPADTVLVYAATGDEDLDAKLVAQAKAKGVLACAVDQKEPSDFITPALVDRDPIVVAIGTEGTAPVLARDIKAKIEGFLEPSLGAVAKAAARLRPLVAKVTNAGGQRRAFWHSFFQKARSQPERATEFGHALLADLQPQQSKLSFITAPEGRTLLSAEEKDALHNADMVVLGPHVHPQILELTRREALQVKQANMTSTHAAKAFQNNQNIVFVRPEIGEDPLSEIAAGFGIVAEVFPNPVPQVAKPRLISPLAQAA